MVVTVSMCPLGERGSQISHTNRDIWVTAYDPVDCSVHNIFLEWELVQLLTGSTGRKIWQDLRQSKHSVWKSIADILISLSILDRFTGEFTLQKLEFYHKLRQLSPQFLSSRVMRDLQRGRKCGQGDEILRQAASVDGRLCVVVVYENWGDLTVAMYHSASGDFFRLVMPLSEIFDLLGKKPLMLRLWISCVKSNSYASTVLVYLLKHVRFFQLEDGSEDVRIEHELPAQTCTKRYQTVARIQKRQVLISTVEDNAGDFQISGYDMSSELTYKLLLEREGLRRILKTCTVPDCAESKLSLATSSSSLLLRRNRKLLYEWICSRLRFQSLLEHPEMVRSGTSPLLFGLHVRESFRILNRWIETSPRNPVQAVSEAEITRRASMIDAAAFSCLQFDQLTLVANPCLPFELEKEYVGTMDWMEAAAGLSCHSQAWKKQLPYMRIDFFVKVHTLFARLRGELEVETKERKKRETWAGMKKEDHDALCIEISSLINSAKMYISSMCQKLSDLYTAATKKIDQWRRVHSELRVIIMGTEVEKEHVPIIPPVLDVVCMFQEDSDSVFLDFINLWIPTASTELHEFISLAIPFNSWCPLVLAAKLLQVCLNRFDLDLKPVLSNLELTFEKIERRGNSLEELRRHKRQVLIFCNFLERQATASTRTKAEDTANELAEVHGVEVNHEEATVSTVIPPDMTTNSPVNTGILIPSNISEPIEEVFLADMPTWAPSEAFPFRLHAQTLVNHLRSFFQQLGRQQRLGRRTSTTNGELTCQRVPYGVLVYQVHNANSRKQQAQFNPRGSALSEGRNVCGPALFWPLQAECVWYQRLLDFSVIYSGLATNTEAFGPEEMSRRRVGGVRSTKYLPWKHFAIERLRLSQAVKRSRITEGVSIDSLQSDGDSVEKENRTFTTFAIGFRQLEMSLGKHSSREFRGNTSVTKCMKHFFALQQGSSQSDKSHMNWRVSISNPQILRDVLAIYDADGQTVQIPCIGSENREGFKMDAIQVEIDDVDKPRRLIFSCREHQTQRTYFVDCNYHNLQNLLHQCQQQESPEVTLPMPLIDEVECRHQVVAMTVCGWRHLASRASQFLVLRKRNGVLCLCLELYTPEIQPRKYEIGTLLSEEESKPDGVSEPAPGQYNDSSGIIERAPVQDGVYRVAENSENTKLSVQQRRCRAETLEERRAVQRSMMHHFQKHQPSIRAAACGRILARTGAPVDTGSRHASEWMQMMREDWCSQELRGLLGLDANVLTKLETAYTPATRRACEYLKSSTKESDTRGLELQMKEIAKAMDQTTLHPNEIEVLQSFRMKRWKRRGKDVNAAAKRAEASLAAVAEWWRWRLSTIQPENITK
ncbi:hypothetical protein JG688_00001273 [Phytophthora aleatoria]|uniref:Uncharacterized protein n=1 Tax=Phytophthora aleatoria TaxID=2496075 RepID=A0A8J5J6M1_9STRA|nr:hypothetical protein JG688_00001273 [Phytophthora aleatoria]